jgi:opacity protein-like surface antigen
LKKFMILAAMLALAMAAAVPAVAQVTLEGGNETESGDVEMEFSVSNEGDYASQCTPAVQFGNTGNFNNTPVFQQYASGADDFEPEGIAFAVEPETAVECERTIQQSAAASG